MGNNKITVFTILIGTFLLFSYLSSVLAATITQISDYSVYLPLVIKQELLTQTPTPIFTLTQINTPTLTQTPIPTPTNSPTQTSTPTLTSTLTPVNTPTSTSTSIQQSVQILPDHSYYVDSIDYLNIVGEVLNNTADNLRFIKISVNIYNSSGQLLNTDFTYTILDNLPAWDKTCFHVLLQEPADWSYYQFETPTYWTDGQPLPNLAVLNDSGSYNSTFGWYEIIGQVRNDQGSRVEYVSPVGTIFNSSGTVIGCDFTYINSTHLDPDQISSFKITFAGRDYTDVNSYRLQVDGNP